MVVDELPLPSRLLRAIAFDAADVSDPVRLPVPPATGRNFVRLQLAPSHDVWMIRWSPGAATGLHDHRGSAGAFCVIEGTLEERTPDSTRIFGAAEHRAMTSAHIHEVRNPSLHHVATSVHVYSPPLRGMRHYDTLLRVVAESHV